MVSPLAWQNRNTVPLPFHDRSGHRAFNLCEPGPLPGVDGDAPVARRLPDPAEMRGGRNHVRDAAAMTVAAGQDASERRNTSAYGEDRRAGIAVATADLPARVGHHETDVARVGERDQIGGASGNGEHGHA